MIIKQVPAPRFILAASLVFLAFLSLPPSAGADAFEDYNTYIRAVGDAIKEMRAKVNEALGKELDYKNKEDMAQAENYLREHEGQFQELNDRVKKAVDHVMPATKELQAKRKEILAELKEGYRDGQDLSRDEIWLVTQFELFPSKESKEILKKAGVKTPTADDFLGDLGEELGVHTGTPRNVAKEERRRADEKKKKEAEEKKKAEEAQKKKGAEEKKKKEEEEAAKRAIEKRKKEEEEKKKAEEAQKIKDAEQKPGLTKDQQKIKNEVEETLRKDPDKVSKKDKDLLDTVLQDEDLMDLFFPDGVPANPDGKSSKENEAGGGKGGAGSGAGSSSGSAGTGFDNFDQMNSGVGGILGGGGGIGSGGPSARDMNPASGGGQMGSGSVGGEGHKHVYGPGGVARDG